MSDEAKCSALPCAPFARNGRRRRGKPRLLGAGRYIHLADYVCRFRDRMKTHFDYTSITLVFQAQRAEVRPIDSNGKPITSLVAQRGGIRGCSLESVPVVPATTVGCPPATTVGCPPIIRLTQMVVALWSAASSRRTPKSPNGCNLQTDAYRPHSLCAPSKRVHPTIRLAINLTTGPAFPA